MRNHRMRNRRMRNRRYESGAKLLYLHEGATADAIVEAWDPSQPLEPRDGARHRLWLKQGGAAHGWVTFAGKGQTVHLMDVNQPTDDEGERSPPPAHAPGAASPPEPECRPTRCATLPTFCSSRRAAAASRRSDATPSTSRRA